MARKSDLVLLALCAIIQLSLQASLPSDKTYQAAVVEFAPSHLEKTNKAMEMNTMNMVNIIESSQTDNLDIIVFPEATLTNNDYKTFLPDPAEKISPCVAPDYDLYLAEISCAARNRKVYVVINVVEQAECTVGKDYKCPDSGYYTFNTNVVFDRNGAVISRYRKTNLYGYEWYENNVMETPDLSIFTTDFGVTFGHFICFDMLFYEPAMQLINEHNITDIIYPTYWYSELPFLTSIQLQEGWAYATGVNLLAAGANFPAEKNTGSGIYAGNLGRLVATIHEEPTTKVLRAEVPKVQYRSEFDVTLKDNSTPSFETPRFTKLALYHEYNVDLYSSKLLAADFTQVQNEAVCHKDFCCHFDISRTFIAQSSMHTAYRYRLVSYFGDETTFQRRDPSATAVCAIIACTAEELYTCGHIFPASVVVGNTHYFSKLDISGTFPKAPRQLLMPNSVDGQMLPVPVGSYEMLQTETNSAIEVNMSLKSPKADLLTFGIWGNYYSNRTSKHNLRPMQTFAKTNETIKNSGTDLTASLLLVLLAYIF